MKQFCLSIQRAGTNIGYVTVNIYKPYDEKIITNDDVIEIIDLHMEREVFKTLDK